jgi:5,5'-dehydrodivanillate O-demethylase
MSVKYRKAEDGSLKEAVVPYKYLPPIKEGYNDNGFPRHRYTMKTIPDHDGMAWETQGLMADRTKEHLGSSDKGLVMFRQMLRLQMDAVKKGEDPIGVVRDAKKNNIIEFKVGEMDKETGRDVTRVRTF